MKRTCLVVGVASRSSSPDEFLHLRRRQKSRLTSRSAATTKSLDPSYTLPTLPLPITITIRGETRWTIQHARRMESPLRSPGDHRARPISRSPAPSSHGSRTPSRHRRSPSGSRDDRSPSPRRSSRYRDDSRSPSRSRGRSLSRDRESRSRSRTPGESPPLRSTKVSCR